MEATYDDTEKSESAMARDRIKQDLESLARDAEALLKATADDMSERAKNARARLTEALERAKSTCLEMQDQTIATAKAAAKRADTVIREHPYESIGVALGVGLLLGALISRK